MTFCRNAICFIYKNFTILNLAVGLDRLKIFIERACLQSAYSLLTACLQPAQSFCSALATDRAIPRARYSMLVLLTIVIRAIYGLSLSSPEPATACSYCPVRLSYGLSYHPQSPLQLVVFSYSTNTVATG